MVHATSFHALLGRKDCPQCSLQTFEVGDTVNVVIDPSYQKGQPHHRFHGLTGKVTGNQGKAYVVSTRVGKMLKELIIRPEHLRKAK